MTAMMDVLSGALRTAWRPRLEKECEKRCKEAGFEAAAEGFDQKDAGVHPAAHDVDCGAIVGESGALGGDDLQIGDEAAGVAVGRKLDPAR